QNGTMRNPGMTGNNPDASVRPDLGIPPSGTIEIVIMSPGDGSTLSTNAPIDVVAQIHVIMGTDFVDPATVKTALVPDGQTAPIPTAALVGPVNSDMYKGQISLANAKSGNYVLTVTAATSSGVSAQQSVHIAVDAGPQIVVVAPIPGGHYKGGMVVLLSA